MRNYLFKLMDKKFGVNTMDGMRKVIRDLNNKLGLPQCGNDALKWNEFISDVDVTIRHTAETVTVLISSTLD